MIQSIRAISLGLVLATLGAVEEPSAGSDMTGEDALRHVQAVAMFDLACLKPAPDFTNSQAVFIASGLRNIAPGIWRDPDRGIAAVISGSELERDCMVALNNGNQDFIMPQLRESVRVAWAGQDISEHPPNADSPAHVFLRGVGSDLILVVWVETYPSGTMTLLLRTELQAQNQ